MIVNGIQRLFKAVRDEVIREDGAPRRRYTLLFLALFIGGSLLFFRIYPRYHGDGVVINRGLIRIGYRYIVRFEPFSFQQGSITKTYTFSGIPNEEYKFNLEIMIGSSPRDRSDRDAYTSEYLPLLNSLTDAGFETDIVLIEDNNEILYAEGFIPKEWLRSSSIAYIGFKDFVMDRKAQYQVRVTIKSQQPLQKELTLVPVLHGGDFYVF